MAATLGVTRKTIYNWLELPCFRAVVDRLTVDHAEEVTNQLGAKSLAVVEEGLDARLKGSRTTVVVTRPTRTRG